MTTSVQAAWPRILAALVATALVSLLAIQVAGASSHNNGNGSGGGTPEVLDAIAALSQQVADFEASTNARLDAIDAAIADLSSSTTDRFDDVDGSVSGVSTLVQGETDQVDGTLSGIQTVLGEVHGWIDEYVANTDPFDVTATTCATYGGAGSLGVGVTGTGTAKLGSKAGIDIYGTGATFDGEVEAAVAGNLGYAGSVGITHEVCYAGVYLANEDALSAAEEDQKEKFEQSAEDFQGKSATGGASYDGTFDTSAAGLVSYGSGAPSGSFASSHAPPTLLELAGAIGADIDGMLAAVESLASVSSAQADPTALFNPANDDFDDFIAAMGPGATYDSNDFFGIFEDPCANGSGLGPAVADICATTAEGLADAIEFIEQTVTDIEDGMNSIVEPTVQAIDSSVSTIDTYMRTTLKGAVDGVRSVVDTIRGWVNTMRNLVADAWDCVTLTGTCGNGY